MILGLFLALLMAAVMAVLLRPMLSSRAPSQADGSELERAVYRDQLAELQRDADRGLIGPEEAAAARNEIARRLLQTADTGKVRDAPAATRAAMLAIMIVPAVAIPVYLATGNPQLPGVPLAERLQQAADNKDMPALIRQVERQLERKPDDLRGWQTLLPVYRSERRWADAAKAYENIIRLAQPSAELMVEYADMLMLANGGEITPAGHDALLQALKLDPRNAKARFFDALAYKQQGKREEAKARLEALLAATPADAPYRQAVLSELQDVSGAKAPALTGDQMAAASGMSSDEKAKMIVGMIDGLEQRLGTTSDDIEGWLRLIRARSVNAEPAKARQSLATARSIFKDNPEALGSLAALESELGLAQ